MSVTSFAELPDFTILERPKSSGVVKVRHFGIKCGLDVWDVAPQRPFGRVSFEAFLDGRQNVQIVRLPQASDPPGASKRLVALEGHVWASWANCQHIAMEVATGKRSSPTRRFIYGAATVAGLFAAGAFLGGRPGTSNLPPRDSNGRFTKK